MRIEEDEIRDAYLKSKGIKVIRFENRFVFENLDQVLDDIRKSFTPHPGYRELPRVLGGEQRVTQMNFVLNYSFMLKSNPQMKVLPAFLEAPNQVRYLRGGRRPGWCK
jgi:hypothetical protein